MLYGITTLRAQNGALSLARRRYCRLTVAVSNDYTSFTIYHTSSNINPDTHAGDISPRLPSIADIDIFPWRSDIADINLL